MRIMLVKIGICDCQKLEFKNNTKLHVEMKYFYIRVILATFLKLQINKCNNLHIKREYLFY